MKVNELSKETQDEAKIITETTGVHKQALADMNARLAGIGQAQEKINKAHVRESDELLVTKINADQLFDRFNRLEERQNQIVFPAAVYSINLMDVKRTFQDVNSFRNAIERFYTIILHDAEMEENSTDTHLLKLQALLDEIELRSNAQNDSEDFD